MKKGYLIAFLVAFLFLILWEPYTSPFNAVYWNDSSIFSLIGRGMAHGYVPYRDLFDHKGPLLFAYYALGYCIFDGKGGVFIPQVLSLTVAILLAYRICRLYLTVQTSVVAMCFIMFTAGGMVCEGGLSEEWSLPFSFYVIYVILRTIKAKETRCEISAVQAMLIGVCCGCHALLRLNNMAPCIFPISTFFICCLWERRYAHCFSRATLMLLGIILSFIPFVCYFAYHGAMSDFIEGAFVMNFRYALSGQQTKTTFEWLYNIPQALAGIPIVCWAIFMLVRGRQLHKIEACVILGCIVCAGLSATLGYSYMHYFLVYLPGLLLCYILLLKLYEINTEKWHALAAGIAMVICMHYYVSVALGTLAGSGAVYFGKKYRVLADEMKKIHSCIPEHERNDVFALDVQPYYYLYNKLIPQFRYFTFQTWHGQANPAIIDKTKTYLLEQHPKWLISGSPLNEEKNGSIEAVIYPHYQYVNSYICDKGNFYLYRYHGDVKRTE